MISYKDENILSVKEGYILNYCDCVSNEPSGLALKIENIYPDTSPYKLKKSGTFIPVPGTVLVINNIINMFVRYKAGSANKNSKLDDIVSRQKYFSECLEAIVDFFEGTENIVKIAVPWGIGPKLSFENWFIYEKMLENFADKMKKTGINAEITIYLKN